MYQRKITNTIANRLQEPRNFIQVITGPRQVGKTTGILQVLEVVKANYHYAAADLPAPPNTSWIAVQWEIARSKLTATSYVILVLDEVQKIASWAEEVKRLWDEDTKEKRDIRIVILGSSALLVQKGLHESLAGRFELIRFTHWSWLECRDAFNFTFDEYIYFGGYPGGAALIHDEPRWRNYIRDSLIETAIAKDILLLNQVTKPALLRQLFVLACEYSGQILSYQKIVGQLHDAGNTTTLAHYKELLEAAYLIKGLEKWSGGVIKRRSSSPKWLALNTALITALSVRSFADWKNDAALWGRLVETAVGAHLVNNSNNELGIYYWAHANNEVDFIVQKANQVWALEVKSGKKINSLPMQGLREFGKKYPNYTPVIIGSGGMPIQEFLEISMF